MPDDIGRYTLAEMRERVLRKLDAYRPIVDTTTGQENPPIVYDPLFSSADVDQALNSSLTAKYVELVLNNRMIFADEETITVLPGVVEYQLPTDLAVLRSLWWKKPEDPYSITPPSDRVHMTMYDEEGPVPSDLSAQAPTYRRNLNFIVLNETPDKVNPQGILVRYIKWVQRLVFDTDVLETEFAQLIQEIIILDAAIKLLTEKSQVEPPSTWASDKAAWETRLALFARNATMPESIDFHQKNMFRSGRP